MNEQLEIAQENARRNYALIVSMTTSTSSRKGRIVTRKNIESPWQLIDEAKGAL